MAILAGTSTLTRKTALLSTYLRGPAMIHFSELEARHLPLADWAAWSPAFLDQFPDNHQIDIKYEQLVAHSQLPGELVSTFAADVRWLAKRAFPNWNGTGEND
uniref:Retrotransposon gag domain-containing protein n=1 Tax=Romanomermis culicivorax TaxID=13658 RepID=A0A915JIL2_ROMCU